MSVRILTGDCREVLKGLPDESVHCVVTSPPYWGLRDYGTGTSGIGLEETMAEHMVALVAVFAEVRRVLRSDGTIWVNYGDAYAGSWGAQGRGDKQSEMEIGGRIEGGNRKSLSETQIIAHPKRTQTGSLSRTGGCKAKDLMGLPWRLAFALQADGWWLRSDIIWAKPNPMPESITDRPTKAHEYIFLLSKRDRYWYDAAAIAEPAIYAGDVKRTNGNDGMDAGYDGNRTREGFRRGVTVGETRNARTVWAIPAAPFPEAHFATFPPELAERCMKAGCPPGGVVLDPFGGAGTVGLVADRLQRDAILIELNPEYAAMAERRIRGDAPMFAEVNP